MKISELLQLALEKWNADEVALKNTTDFNEISKLKKREEQATLDYVYNNIPYFEDGEYTFLCAADLIAVVAHIHANDLIAKALMAAKFIEEMK